MRFKGCIYKVEFHYFRYKHKNKLNFYGTETVYFLELTLF